LDGPDASDGLGAAGFFLIWEAELTLTTGRTDAVRARMSAAYVRKKASQPITAHTCGCAFKNPQGASAGWLLDQCGFRGRREGGMALSDRHANFLVNLGGGTAAQALALLHEAREAVSQRFGVRLEAEVRMVP
jgi:UDP-N-acetylmuramate dehydrogenase